MVHEYMFSFKFESEATAQQELQTKSQRGKKAKEKKEDKVDHVMAYAREVLSLGLLYMEYCDAIREGDGLRIVQCWKYMLLIFRVTNKRKYAIQAATLLLQNYCVY